MLPIDSKLQNCFADLEIAVRSVHYGSHKFSVSEVEMCIVVKQKSALNITNMCVCAVKVKIYDIKKIEKRTFSHTNTICVVPFVSSRRRVFNILFK